MSSNKRNSNIELLRILSMLLIITHHYSVHGSFSFPTLTTNKIIVHMLSMGGKLGVNIFVLITGYFLVHSKYKPRKILYMWLQIEFYSVTLFLLMHIFNGAAITKVNIRTAFLPVTHQTYWFASTYIVLYLLSPYINTMIKNINKKEFERLIIICITLWCISPTFLKYATCLSNLSWFFTLYCVGAYLALYPDILKHKCSVYISLTIISFIALIGTVPLFSYLGTYHRIFAENVTYFLSGNRLLAFACSVFALIAFSKMNMPCISFINIISSATFGVYLLHDNYFIRPFLWGKIFKNNHYAASNKLIIHAFICIFITYFVCTIIELIRKMIIHTLLNSRKCKPN